MGPLEVSLSTQSRSTVFTSFVEEIARPLRSALIAAYGSNVGEEVTAEALAYAWEYWDRVRAMENPTGYLYRVGQSRARRGIFRRSPQMGPSRPATDSPWVEPGLDSAMAGLTRRQRAAVLLVHGHGWTVAELARLWGVSFSTARGHLTRGMTKLRKDLGATI